VGVPVEKLLLDNRDTLRDLDSPLAGKRLTVCSLGVSPAQPAPAPVPAPAPAPAPSTPPAASVVAPSLVKSLPSDSRTAQLRSLLGFKAAIDRQGTLAWSAERAANAGYCSFFGITCDTQGNVAKIEFNQVKLGGTLPPASVLRDLTALTGVELDTTGITGTLPTDWGALTQLQDIRIIKNPGITGTLPRTWAGLARLKVLYL
jgi:hypothetical protein